MLIYIWLVAFTVNLKFMVFYEAYERFWLDAMYWVGVWLLGNVMLISLGFSVLTNIIANES